MKQAAGRLSLSAAKVRRRFMKIDKGETVMCTNCGGRLIGKTDDKGNTVWVCPKCD